VLAQLDAIPGVAESRVDWEGKHVLVRLASGASPEAVLARATPVLGEGAARLDRVSESEKVASFRRGEQWMRSRETVRLSQHEAVVLGKSLSKGAAAKAGLTDDQTARVRSILTEEITRLFERMHASGTRPDEVKQEDLAELERRLRSRFKELATAPQVDRIIEHFKSAIGMCESE
jgi:hypothetical protein